MSLYRNYRPKDFPSLVGQDHIKITLLNAVKAGQIAHAFLFTGPRGTGKTTTARLMAKAINAGAMTEDGRFDGDEIAEEIDAGRLIDVIEIDAASNRGIDEIRDLREKINYSPTRAKNKVYIIDEVHMLTKEAFNALLKTLEEPPAFVYFILATTEINKVPETIISRCQRYDFKRITEVDLLARLKFVVEAEGLTAEEEALKIIARQARGGLRDALSLLEQLITGKTVVAENVKKVLGMSNFASIESVYKLIGESKAAEAMEEVNALFMSGIDLVQFNKDFLDYLRGEMLEKVKADDLSAARRVIQLIGNFQEAYEKQKYSYIPELPLEVAIVKSALRIQPVNLSEDENSGSKKKPEVKTEVKIVERKPVAEVNIDVAKSLDLPNARQATADTTASAKDEVIVVENSGNAKIDSQSDFKIDLAELKKRWPKVLERIQHPLARRCLSTGQLMAMEGETLVMGFSSNFNKEKLFVPELLQISEEAIKAEFGATLKLTGKVEASLMPAPIVNTENNASNRPSWDANEGVSAEQSNAGGKILNSALNVFGGQVIE